MTAASTLVRRSALQAAELAVVFAISEALGRAVSGEVLMEETLARCLDAGGVAQGALYLIDEEGSLHLAAAVGYRSDPLSAVASFFGHADLLR